jgi:pilus assembly protein CpaF
MDFGPISSLLQDDSINEIMVNSFDSVFIEKSGRIEPTTVNFGSRKELEQFIASLGKSLGGNLSRETPFLDAQLENGSRINIVVPPMAFAGPTLTIRKFPSLALTLDRLVSMGTLTSRCAHFLKLCVRGRVNLIVSGGTSSGKTTFLNALTEFIPEDERIITIEDTPELNLNHQNWVRLCSVNTIKGESITTRDCLVNALRMRPDRIIVGECRRNETFEMLQAMNTGHSGSLTTVHANTPRDCLSRIESLILSHADFPLGALRKQIVSAIDIIVQLRRDKSGERIVTEVLELTGTEGDIITAQNIFSLNSMEESAPTGILPKLSEKLLEKGIPIPAGFFNPDKPFSEK